jgi:PKD repeat protein
VCLNLPALLPGCWNLRSWLLVATGCVAAACGGGDLVLPDDGSPTSIQVVGGTGQSGQVGDLLDTPIKVAVTGPGGEPVEGATVEFELTSAGEGAEMLPPSATTDAAGNAEAQIHLGSKVGVQSGEARVVVDGASTPKATFTATAIATPSKPDNRPPAADYNWHCEGLGCQFTDASSDSDGRVNAWRWDFGDDQTSDQREPAHAYSSPGTYEVTLRVTDDGGLSDETTAHVSVEGPPAPPNQPPHADFEVHCIGLTCVFLDRSRDDDGSISDWTWNFGDGSAASADQNPTHTYATHGKYGVLLTVTDNMGAADARTRRADPKD